MYNYTSPLRKQAVMIRVSSPPSCTKLLIWCFCFLLVLLLLLLLFSSHLNNHSSQRLSHFSYSTPDINKKQTLLNFVTAKAIRRSLKWKTACRFDTCFNINRCILNQQERVSVYVYPQLHYQFTESPGTEPVLYDPPVSWEYEELLKAVTESPYYEPNGTKACVLLPSLDLLNERMVNTSIHSGILQALNL